MFESKALRRKRNRNGLEGLPKANLEERLLQLQREGDWSAFMDAFGLLVYDIMLFPQIEAYIDLAAIDAFLAKRDRGKNPIIAVLANTYYYLNYFFEKNGKGLRCCTSLQYLWMTAHLFHNGKRTAYPIEDDHWSCIRPLTKGEWTTCLDEATKKSIHWYSQQNEREDVIIKCGGFLNVPLMGTQGAINYNPELMLRQAGYPMVLPLIERAITPFIIHGIGMQNGEYIKRIRHAWKSIIRKGPEWGLWSCAASSSYKAWLKHRLEQISLTFNDPRFDTAKEPNLRSIEPQRPSKRNREDDSESQMNEEESRKTSPEQEHWARAILGKSI
ncbi:hypothetical protein CR513_40462, partial [Mucuna pruriens]